MRKITNEEAISKTATFNATLYPNPAVSSTQLQITGKATNVSVTITDMSGKMLWQSNPQSSALINLPTARLSSGFYFVTVTNGKESKTIKLVKQ